MVDLGRATKRRLEEVGGLILIGPTEALSTAEVSGVVAVIVEEKRRRAGPRINFLLVVVGSAVVTVVAGSVVVLVLVAISIYNENLTQAVILIHLQTTVDRNQSINLNKSSS